MQVPCYSEECVTSITGSVTKEVLQHVTNNVSWNEKEIKRCYEYFLHMYRNVINEHVVYTTGMQQNGPGKGTEYHKKYWDHRKRLLNKYLVPQWDTSLLNTTRRRKNYPRRCCKSLATRFQLRTSHLIQAEYKPKRRAPHEEPVLKPLTEEMESTLPQAANRLSTTLKGSTDSVQCLEDTQELLHILNAGLTSTTDAVLFPQTDSPKQTRTEGNRAYITVKPRKPLN